MIPLQGLDDRFGLAAEEPVGLEGEPHSLQRFLQGCNRRAVLRTTPQRAGHDEFADIGHDEPPGYAAQGRN
jgi:hypothetical protein